MIASVSEWRLARPGGCWEWGCARQLRPDRGRDRRLWTEWARVTNHRPGCCDNWPIRARQHRLQRPAPPGPCQGHDGVFHLVRADIVTLADCHDPSVGGSETKCVTFRSSELRRGEQWVKSLLSLGAVMMINVNTVLRAVWEAHLDIWIYNVESRKL